MAKYRKKPVVVEAVRYMPHETCAELAAFLGIHHDAVACRDTGKRPEWIIQTLEGEMAVSPGDWVIKGVNGEFYPCKPDIFEKTYEAADTTTPSAARHEHRFEINGNPYRVCYPEGGHPVIEWSNGTDWNIEDDIGIAYIACALLAGISPQEER